MKLSPVDQMLQDALARHRAGDLAAAAAAYDRILALAPRTFDALFLGGMVALQQGRAPAAIGLLERAAAAAPANLACARQLALAHSAAGRHAEAEARLREILKRQPLWHEAWDSLAVILQFLGRINEAIDCSKKSVALQPKYAQGWYHLGLTLLFADRPAEALECHEKACAADPRMARAHHGRGLALQHLHRLTEAVQAYGAALSLNPRLLDTRSYRLLALQYLDGISRDRLYREHREYGSAAAAGVPGCRPAPAARPFDPHRPIRVAFLSPDLRTHSVAYFLEPILRHLDPGRFEILLYHDHFQVDSTSARLQGLAKLWRNFAGQPDEGVAARILADAPDILVDLAGHTGMNRLPLFARRLAPVQATYLGYPDTTGLAAMDCRFVDAITDPPGEADAYATERLVRFAQTAWCYAPPDDAPAPARDAGGEVTFGCFNNPAKITDETLRQWAPLFETIPGSRLLLKGGGLGGAEARTRLERRLRGCGIEPDRVELAERTAGTAEHLAFYGRVDVALDTFPYNGTTTTCEALWMGVPVVTLRGDRHCSRVGASLLAAAGLADWVALSWTGYREIADGLARNRARLAGARGELRSRLQSSPLMDHGGQASRFGAALIDLWRERCARGAIAA